MIISCRNTLSGLVPLFDSDSDEKKKLKLNKHYQCEVKLIRNPKFHAKYFALLNVGHRNSQNLDHLPFDVYRKVIIMRAGFVEVYKTDKGDLYEPKSISFGKMSEDEFQDVYSRSLDVIVEDLGCTSEEIENEIRSFF